MVSQTPINHTIFWKSVMRTFRCIYVNRFNRLRFLAEVSTELQKKHLSGNLRAINPEGNRKTRQMTPFFHQFFWLQLFITFIFVFANSHSLFSWGPPFVPFWSVKCLNFGQKLPTRTAHHTFLESRYPEVTKNPYYVLSHEGHQKKVSAHGLE